MAADYVMKANDLLPAIQGAASTAGTPVNLTSATLIKFFMRAADANFQPVTTGTLKVNATATAVAPTTSGVLRYDWVVGDTAVPGNYVGEFQVTFPGAKPQTLPTTSYITITILADLDGAG